MVVQKVTWSPIFSLPGRGMVDVAHLKQANKTKRLNIVELLCSGPFPKELDDFEASVSAFKGCPEMLI
jgi:hypothetical protein